MKDALARILNKNRDELIVEAEKLFTKEYQTRREIHDLEMKLKKARESLEKTEEKAKKVRAGDLSVLFSNDGGGKKEEVKDTE